MSGTTSSLSQSLGVVYLLWGGTKIDIDTKSATFNRGGSVATAVVAGNTISQSFMTVPAKVSAKFPLKKGQSLDALRALNGTELQVVCDSGQTYIVNGACISGDPKVTGGAGNNVSAEWTGSPAVELVVS